MINSLSVDLEVPEAPNERGGDGTLAGESDGRRDTAQVDGSAHDGHVRGHLNRPMVNLTIHRETGAEIAMSKML